MTQEQLVDKIIEVFLRPKISDDEFVNKVAVRTDIWDLVERYEKEIIGEVEDENNELRERIREMEGMNGSV